MDLQKNQNPSLKIENVLTRYLALKSLALGGVLAIFGGALMWLVFLAASEAIGLQGATVKLISAGLTGVICGVIGTVVVISDKLKDYTLHHK